MPIYSIINDCIYTAMAEFSSCNIDHIVCKAEKIKILINLYRKSFANLCHKTTSYNNDYYYYLQQDEP